MSYQFALSSLFLAGDAPFTTEDFINKLVPNIWSFVIQLAALVVLFIAIYFIAYKPVKKLVDKRKDYVERNLKDSERAKKSAETREKAASDLIDDSKREANAIILKAKEDALTAGDGIKAAAEKEAQRRQIEADESIRLAEKKSTEKIRKEIVNVAMDASEHVLGREISGTDNERLLESFVDSLSEKEGKDD